VSRAGLEILPMISRIPLDERIQHAIQYRPRALPQFWHGPVAIRSNQKTFAA
jgi:hypothetical protein